MRYTASEKLEIIRLIEQSNLSIRRTLAQLGIPKSTFYGWYRRFVEGGVIVHCYSPSWTYSISYRELALK